MPCKKRHKRKRKRTHTGGLKLSEWDKISTRSGKTWLAISKYV